jgi:hypothetical protein
MSMSGSFLPSLGRQQPQFTRVEGADLVMKSSEPNSSAETTLYGFWMLIQDLKVHVFVGPSSQAYHPS